MPVGRLEEGFDELQRASEILEAERLRRLGEICRRRSFERDGHLSAVSWLANRFHMGFGAAARMVKTAAALRRMPASRRALATGTVSSSAVQALVEAHLSRPAAFARDEGLLLDAARSLPVRELHRVVAHWREASGDPNVQPASDGLDDRRRLHVSPTMFGMVRVDGDLDRETGQAMITALRSIVDAEVRDADGRTPAQRRVDALREICLQWLHRTDRPTVAGERPHLVVTVDPQALQGDSAGRAELDDVGPVDHSVARRVGCDAAIIRVVARGRSEPLDVGRRTPVVPPSMRRAAIVRDRGCRFPGCDRPHGWCDAHHVVHWADGGPTALSNLILLCRRHHRLVHQGFGLELEGGRAVFRRPDGTVLEDRAPP